MKSEQASSSEEMRSEQGGVSPKSASILDFVYHDVRRVGSLLSQFETHGVRQTVKDTGAVAQSEQVKSVITAGAGLAGLLHSKLDLDEVTASEERDSLETIYDPLWSNARRLLDFIESQAAAGEDIERARIGGLVFVEGALSIVDLGLMKPLWAKPTIRKALTSTPDDTSPSIGANRHERRRQAKLSDSMQPRSILEMTLDVLPELPHEIQGSINSGGISTWFNLDEGSIVGSASSIILKHGPDIQGVWRALGILDARPTSEADEDTSPPALMPETSPVGAVAVNIAEVVRAMMGRPMGAYGITPILIFREIKG